MVKINVISGFLGAGKTTLIKKLLTGSLKNERVVLLENEYGDVGIDGSFMQEAGIVVNELNAGCICCTLAGDFQKSIDQLIDTYHPDRILVEPTGVGKLSEILSAVEAAKARHDDIEVRGSATVVDAGKARMYMKNFGEFFLDQIKSASTVIFSRTQLLSADRVEKSRVLISEQHPDARVITTPWDDMDPDLMLQVIEDGKPIVFEAMELDDDDDDEDEHEHHHHHHHHHDDEECDDPECECHHHHHDDDDDDDDEHEHHHHHHDGEECDDPECECHHHHHDDDDDDDEHEHHHHHHEHGECSDPNCSCHHHHHHHHGEGHDADEVFQNIGVETANRYEQSDISAMLDALSDEEEYGRILRAKGVLQDTAGNWFEFDYVPGEAQLRPGKADYTGRFCVIGVDINEKALRELFRA